jgi:hypothetical protein
MARGQQAGCLLRYSDRMTRVVRSLFLWLLVLALPVQGWAAAAMASCSHHHGAASHAAVVGHGANAQVDHGQAPADADETGHGDTEAAPASPHTCSACAACCTVGALPSPVLTVPADAAAPTVFAALQPTVGAFAADGPERPPRQACA